MRKLVFVSSMISFFEPISFYEQLICYIQRIFEKNYLMDAIEISVCLSHLYFGINLLNKMKSINIVYIWTMGYLFFTSIRVYMKY